MKSKWTIAALMMACALPIFGRELKSADGGKVMEAEFIRYVPSTDTVMLKANGRDMVVPAGKFSEDDRKFFVEAQLEIDKKHAVRVKTTADNENSKEANNKQQMLSTRTVRHKFEVTNTSQSEFDGLELRYWIISELFNQKSGEGKIKITSDRKKLARLEGGRSEVVESPGIKLTLGAKSTADCKCAGARAAAAAKAADVERDRVLGTKVEVVDSSGQVIFSETSSNRVESLLAGKND